MEAEQLKRLASLTEISLDEIQAEWSGYFAEFGFILRLLADSRPCFHENFVYVLLKNQGQLSQLLRILSEWPPCSKGNVD